MIVKPNIKKLRKSHIRLIVGSSILLVLALIISPNLSIIWVSGVILSISLWCLLNSAKILRETPDLVLENGKLVWGKNQSSLLIEEIKEIEVKSAKLLFKMKKHTWEDPISISTRAYTKEDIGKLVQELEKDTRSKGF